MSDALVTMIEKMAFKLEEVEVERDALKQKLAEQEAAWQQDLRTGARALRERDELRAALEKISEQQASRVQDEQCVICGRNLEHLCEGCIADKALGDPVFKP